MRSPYLCRVLKHRWRKEPLAIVSLVLTVISLWWTVLVSATFWASSDIRKLIDEEARAARNHDTERAVSLFTESALIRIGNLSLPGSQSYQGQARIRFHYQTLPDFSYLVHPDVAISEVNLFSGTARSVSSTDGMMIENGTQKPRRNLDGDVWEFHREGGVFFLPWTGQWKISSLTSQ